MNNSFLPLTKKQRTFYEALRSFILANRMAPTIQQLQTICHLSSPRAVSQYLASLESKGLIRRNRYQVRGIELVDELSGVTTITIPVIASAGCDNVAIFAQRNFGEFICVAANMLSGRSKERIVSIKAIGDSMVDAGISEGDYVLVEMTQAAHEGDIVVAIVDGCAVIKKLEIANNALILRPVSSNPEYRPIIVNRDFRLFGTVIDVIRRGQTGDIEIVPLYPSAVDG
jgi:repressor LexA